MLEFNLASYLTGVLQGASLVALYLSSRKLITLWIDDAKEKWMTCIHESGHAVMALVMGATEAQPHFGTKGHPASSRPGVVVSAFCLYKGILPDQYTSAGGDAATALMLNVMANPQVSDDKKTCEDLGYNYGDHVRYVGTWMEQHQRRIKSIALEVFLFGKKALRSEHAIDLRKSWRLYMSENPAPEKRGPGCNCGNPNCKNNDSDAMPPEVVSALRSLFGRDFI